MNWSWGERNWNWDLDEGDWNVLIKETGSLGNETRINCKAGEGTTSLDEEVWGKEGLGLTT